MGLQLYPHSRERKRTCQNQNVVDLVIDLGTWLENGGDHHDAELRDLVKDVYHLLTQYKGEEVNVHTVERSYKSEVGSEPSASVLLTKTYSSSRMCKNQSAAGPAYNIRRCESPEK